jgi:hypothetical protein
MFASVRTYRCEPDQVEDLLGIVDSDFIPMISERPGFCGYQVIDCGDGSLVTISCFSGSEEAEASTALASNFISEKLQEFDVERTDAKAGAIRVSVAAQEMLEPAHV